ncbi:hypothetical protein [Marinicella litoralis]|uniref:Uncharacterized protein n=1 Tax=Marinicella litoralis TaxID=644220 RepID=A0A4R6XUR4_9GAMM|nr:hypothetical protein [Marinicella litoralis]TDR23576.1 hypothetical protein C8D91_0439 [Marinicella litoralis]
MKKITPWVFIICMSFSVAAEVVYDNDLFNAQAEKLVFDSEAKLAAYIKLNMPSTYLYFERLDSMSKKRVFQRHQENQNKDLTEIVLLEYRNRS